MAALIVIAQLLACVVYSRTQSLQEFIPEVIQQLPKSALDVKFGDLDVDFGNELTPTQVKDRPEVVWDAEPDTFYTLCITNPDVPSKENHTKAEIIHWLVTNIPGSKVEEGEEIAEFMSSGPPKLSGIHRYIFLLFKQPAKLEFSEPRIDSVTLDGRFSFSIQKFAEKYNFELPAMAGNFYQAQWDEYVDELAKVRNYKAVIF